MFEFVKMGKIQNYGTWVKCYRAGESCGETEEIFLYKNEIKDIIGWSALTVLHVEMSTKRFKLVSPLNEKEIREMFGL